MKRTLDYPLLMTTFFLLAVGITMVFSSSGVLAQERFQDSTFFLKKEIVMALVGLAALFLTLILPLRFFQKVTYPLLFLSIVLMILPLVPAFRTEVGGAMRWIRLGPFSLQPSELAKLALVFFMAHILSKRREKVGKLIPSFLIISLLIGLTLMGRDLGAAAVMGGAFFFLMLVGGVRPSYLLSEVLLALPLLYYLIASVPYRRKRILAFLNPWGDERGAGFQIIQSYLAFHVGGLFGQGLGEGKQKLFYLPEAHTDFIFSVIGEELGLLGTFVVVILFAIWIYRAFRISWQAPDLFSSYLALGITLVIGVQALFNLGVVMGLLPTKGLTLPFVSYGGTSLIVSLASVGILLNISLRSER